MTRSLRITLIALLVGAAFAGPARAEATPAAQAWLDRAVKATYDSPIKVRMTGEMDMAALFGALAELGEQPPADAELPTSMTFRMDVDMVLDGPRHQRTTTKIAMSGMPEMPNAPPGGTLEMSMLQVLDGEKMWMQMANPMTGGTMVMTMSIAQMERIAGEMADKLGLPGGLSLGDPVSQLKLASRLMDFDVVSVAEGEVTLAAKLDWNALKAMMSAQPLEGFEDDAMAKIMDKLGAFRIVLDERTALPKRFTLGETTRFMTMEFSEYRIIGKAEIPAEAFVYAAPPEAQVMDLGALIDRMTPRE